MKFYKLIFIFLVFTSLASFKPIENKAPKNNITPIYFLTDKQQLETLMRKAYEWIETKASQSDFDPIENEKGDKYIGLDIKAHNKKLAELKKSNFFAQEFLDNYNKIGLKIGNNLQTKKMEWLVGDLPPYGNDANMWCNCQDNPEEYWKTLRLNNLKIDNNKASFSWMWTAWKEGSNYKVRAVKENGIWKIAYLQGFDYKSLTSI